MNRRQKILTILLIDTLLIMFSNVFSFFFMSPYIGVTSRIGVIAAAIQIIGYWFIGYHMNIFSRINRYSNLREIMWISIAFLIVFFIESALFWRFGESGYSERYLLLTTLLNVMLVVASRIGWRIYIEWLVKRDKAAEVKNTLIVGAGSAGRLLVNSINNASSNMGLRVIGFVDDDPNKVKTYLEGKKILGTVDEMAQIVAEKDIQLITIAIPSLSQKELTVLVNKIAPLGIPVNHLPSIEGLACGDISVSKLKNVDLVDLLGREEVALDIGKISDQIQGKTVLVTGAGGSIGSEICRQLVNFKPKTLILLGHGENSIYLINQELAEKKAAETELIPVIADIQDKKRIEEIFAQYSPEIVYHAAAHKHVPLMEYNPKEAVKNNVFGTKNLAEAAKRSSVENFIMISSDKANNPPNVMGSTKRIAEMIVTGMNETESTKFAAVRFGNVLGSRGSVIPLFKKQIEKGGPVTVTDFRMTRYFMTIPEASRLVLQAGALAKGGEIFVLDMGEPVRIYDLARNMIVLSGYSEDEIEIVETGIRPGEKLYEELLVDKERQNQQIHEKIFVGTVNGFDLEDIERFCEEVVEESSSKLAADVVDYAQRSCR